MRGAIEMEDDAQYLLDSKGLDVNHDCGRLGYSVCGAEDEAGIAGCRPCCLPFYRRIFFSMGPVVYRAPPNRVSVGHPGTGHVHLRIFKIVAHNDITPYCWLQVIIIMILHYNLLRILCIIFLYIAC